MFYYVDKRLNPFLDADIDTLCVIPSSVTREEFFDVMSDHLVVNHRVHDLNVVKDAFVPVIKFKYDDIAVSDLQRIGLKKWILT